MVRFIFTLLTVLTSQIIFGLYANAQSQDDDILLDAHVIVHYTRNTYTPSKNNATHSEQNIVTVTGDLLCDVMTLRLKSFVNHQNRLANCDASTHCPVVKGSSKYKVYDEHGNINEEVNNSLDVQNSVTVKDDLSEGLTTSITYQASGLNDMDALNLEIKPYNAPFGQVQSLSPQYVVWITGGLGFDFTNPQRKPMGNGEGQRWDYEKQKLVPMPGPFEIIIPSNINEADYVTEPGETYEQLIMSNYKEFENYLLHPDGDFSINLSGLRYYFSEGSEESDGTVSVVITLRPHFKLNSLTK